MLGHQQPPLGVLAGLPSWPVTTVSRINPIGAERAMAPDPDPARRFQALAAAYGLPPRSLSRGCAKSTATRSRSWPPTPSRSCA